MTNETANQIFPMIEALNKWLEAVRDEPIDPNKLIPATTTLVQQLNPNYKLYGHLHGKYFTIRKNVEMLSSQFLWDDYSDSDTDAPCDLEWDIHHLQAEMDPSYILPPIDEIGPAYVMATVYDTPDV